MPGMGAFASIGGHNRLNVCKSIPRKTLAIRFEESSLKVSHRSCLALDGEIRTLRRNQGKREQQLAHCDRL